MKKYFILFFIHTIFLFAQSDVVINEPGKSFIKFPTKIYIDKSSQLTFDEILHNIDFKEYSNNISEGYVTGIVWIQFTIQNKTDSALEYYVKFAELFQDTIDCFIVSNSNVIEHYKSGVGYFENNQTNRLKKPSFQVDLEPLEEKKVYLRITSKYPYFTSFYLFSKPDMQEYTYKNDLLYALIIGGIISLLLYNTAIYFFSKDKTYLYYIIYSLTFLIWQVKFCGFYPFDAYSLKESFYKLSAVIPLSFAFLVFFSRSILHTKELFPRTDIFLRIVTYFYFVLAFITLIDMELATPIMNGTTSLMLPVLLFMGFRSYLKGNKTAIFYIIAQVFFISLTTIFSLAAEGYLEYNLFTRHGIIVGFIIENILFSLALAYRIKTLQQDKLVLIQDTNKKLEAEVDSRTQELHNMVKQRELLLKELYHRVKNNFQMIISLLWFESQKEVNGATNQEAFTTLITRVKAMSSINNLLYNTKDNMSIQSENYILSIIKEIRKIYSKDEVIIEQKIDLYELNIDQAMLLGMIMYEVLLNSVKHYKQDGICMVKIEFKIDNKYSVLLIKDNGQEYSSAFETSDGMGLNLIKDFSRKLLDSQLMFSYENGNVLQLRFKNQ